MRFGILVCFIVFLFSCSSDNANLTDKRIDEFISKYNDVKFDEMRDISIAQRSKSADEIIYVVGKGDGSMPVYFATYDLQNKTVTTINKSNLERSKVQEYLTAYEIYNAVNTIRKYDFYLLAVDSFKNVFINPFYGNEPAYLLRIQTFTGDSIVKKGYVFELYKENWYLNRTRR